MAKTSIGRETRDILWKAGKEAKEHWKEPPEAQVPVGDSGWYTSPNLQSDKGVDPRNCAEWPDSPYCGGNPWTKTPVGFDFDYGVDKCGAWVEATPILGFTKLPPVSIGYRQPGECREEKKPPPPEPAPDDSSRPVDPLRFPDTIDPNVPVLVVLIKKYTYAYNYRYGGKDPWGQNEPPTFDLEITHQGITNSYYPADYLLVESYRRYSGNYSQVPAIGGGSCITMRATQTQTYTYDYSVFPPRPIINTVSTSDSAESNAFIASDQDPPQPQYPNSKRYLARNLVGNYRITGMGNNINFINSCVLYGTLNEIKKDWEGYVRDVSSISPPGMYGGIYEPATSGYIYKEEWEIGYISIPDKDKHPPPPDAERKRKCCMQCCNGGSQQQNKQDKDNAEILRLLRKIDKNIGEFPFKAEIFDADDNKVGIQKRNINVASVSRANALAIGELQRTLKAIGIDHFPIYSPSSVIEDESNGLLGDLGDLKNKLFKQKIDSLAEFLVWRAKNDNEIFGKWQEVIEIQDSDPNVKGNQPKRVVLPNMAKTLREIILLLSVLIKSQGFSMDALLKMYIDVANTKVSVSAIEAIIRDVQDYLDYPTVTKSLDVPLGITIPKDNDPTDDKEDVERFLKNSTVKAMFDDWTGEGSIHDMLLVLLDAASRTIQKPHT